MTNGSGPGGDAGPTALHDRNRARTVRALALSIAVVVVVLVGAGIAAARANEPSGFLGWFCLLLPAGVFALFYGRRAEAAVVNIDGPLPDEHRARVARRVAVGAIALSTMLTVGLMIWGSWNGLEDVGNTFFSWEHIRDSLPLTGKGTGRVLRGFKLNVAIFITAEAIVLPWALLVAAARELPGRAAAPVRWLAIVYVDVFRGLPALVTIFLVGFGLPLTQLPIIRDTSDIDTTFLTIPIDQLFVLGVLALVLVYGAYVAEVFRAGMESVHWSQRSAARGLGLTQGQTLRHVVIPQAVRRIIPPLLNDFIGLQKDTALLSVIGVLEGFNLAKIYANNHFNLSSLTGLGICFLVITIPMTRFTDYLVRRDQARLLAVR